jgi:hypothetical protein
MANEKTEEKQEKDVEKREEKFEEKWRRDPLGSIVAALILIWAGVVLLAHNMGFISALTGVLDMLRVPAYDLPFEWYVPFITPRGVQAFLLGTGAVIVVEVILRLIVKAYRRGIFGSLIGAVVCFALGLGNWEVIWPLVVIAVGLSILVGALTGRRRRL